MRKWRFARECPPRLVTTTTKILRGATTTMARLLKKLLRRKNYDSLTSALSTLTQRRNRRSRGSKVSNSDSPAVYRPPPSSRILRILQSRQRLFKISCRCYIPDQRPKRFSTFCVSIVCMESSSTLRSGLAARKGIVCDLLKQCPAWQCF